MKRTLIAALAATVALPVLATSASAQQGPYGYTPADDYPYHWGEARRGVDHGPRGYPNPPYTPDRYVTDWDDVRARGYAEGYRQGRYDEYGERPYADDRWSERRPPRRDFDRRMPPPGYDEQAGYGSDSSGHGEMRERHHRGMAMRDHGGGHRDLDFRRDFKQDGRRGYYQDSSYEEMPFEGPRGHGMRQGMRMIERFDADDDGRVTQEEVDRYRADRLRQFDADDNDQLTLDEYEALWLDAMRERMVRRFQGHDRDGDGLVTLEEFSEPTRHMVRMRDRNRDEAITERDFGRPVVEAPMGGAPNRSAESRPRTDEDASAHGPRPEVEAPMGDAPNEPAGEETYNEIEETESN